MIRRRTFSPGRNKPVQFCDVLRPLISEVNPCTSSTSLGSMRMRPHMRRSFSVALRPSMRASRIRS